MSKKSKKRRRENRQSKNPPRTNPSDKPSHARRFSKIAIGIALGAATLVGGYTAIWPRISIEPPPDALDPFVRNIFTLPFKLVNNGYFSIYDLSVTCSPNLFWPVTEEENFKFEHHIPVSLLRVEVIKLVFNATRVEPQVPNSFICKVWNRDVSEPQTLSRAELDMDISFRPISIIPWTLNRRLLFYTNTTEDGKFHWIEPSLEPSLSDIRKPRKGEKGLYTGQRPESLMGKPN